MAKHIRAGTVEEIYNREGEWLFIDIGFSPDKRTCGVLEQPEKDTEEQPTPKNATFGESVNLAKNRAQQGVPLPLNLVLEAPLSVTFNQHGNPTPRACDIKDGKNRSWHKQPALGLITATGYLLQTLAACGIQRDVRLYEGFASFKLPGVKSSHTRDVKALRDAVWDPRNPERGEIFCPTELKRCKNDKLVPAFGFMGMDLGIPPVIRVIIRP